MKKISVPPILQTLDTFWEDRFEQVQLAVEGNFNELPTYREHYKLYHDAIDEINAAHPDIHCLLEELTTAMHLYYSDLAMEAYKQGAKDWMQLLRSVNCDADNCSCSVAKEVE